MRVHKKVRVLPLQRTKRHPHTIIHPTLLNYDIQTPYSPNPRTTKATLQRLKLLKTPASQWQKSF